MRYRVSSILDDQIDHHDTVMNLRLEGEMAHRLGRYAGAAELEEGGTCLVMITMALGSDYADVIDQQGLALVAQADPTAIGLLRDQVDPANTARSSKSRLTGVGVDKMQLPLSSAPAHTRIFHLERCRRKRFHQFSVLESLKDQC